MFTADMARQQTNNDLDARIEAAVREARGSGAYLRVNIEDPFVHRIGYELEQRGFKNIVVPDIILKGDVYFEW